MSDILRKNFDFKLSIVGRKCGVCYKEFEHNDEVYQVPTDNNYIGFDYIHRSCMSRLEAVKVSRK